MLQDSFFSIFYRVVYDKSKKIVFLHCEQKGRKWPQMAWISLLSITLKHDIIRVS